MVAVHSPLYPPASNTSSPVHTGKSYNNSLPPFLYKSPCGPCALISFRCLCAVIALIIFSPNLIRTSINSTHHQQKRRKLGNATNLTIQPKNSFLKDIIITSKFSEKLRQNLHIVFININAVPKKFFRSINKHRSVISNGQIRNVFGV